jgi:hypothetical protein
MGLVDRKQIDMRTQIRSDFIKKKKFNAETKNCNWGNIKTNTNTDTNTNTNNKKLSETIQKGMKNRLTLTCM